MDCLSTQHVLDISAAHCRRLNARVARPPECSPFLRFGFRDNIRVRKLLCVHRTFGGEKIEGTITKNVYFIQQIFLITTFVWKSPFVVYFSFDEELNFAWKPILIISTYDERNTQMAIYVPSTGRTGTYGEILPLRVVRQVLHPSNIIRDIDPLQLQTIFYLTPLIEICS